MILDKCRGNGEKKNGASPVSLISIAPVTNTLPDLSLKGPQWRQRLSHNLMILSGCVAYNTRWASEKFPFTRMTFK